MITTRFWKSCVFWYSLSNFFTCAAASVVRPPPNWLRKPPLPAAGWQPMATVAVRRWGFWIVVVTDGGGGGGSFSFFEQPAATNVATANCGHENHWKTFHVAIGPFHFVSIIILAVRPSSSLRRGLAPPIPNFDSNTATSQEYLLP